MDRAGRPTNPRQHGLARTARQLENMNTKGWIRFER
jgi:hypothetical protein